MCEAVQIKDSHRDTSGGILAERFHGVSGSTDEDGVRREREMDTTLPRPASA